MIYAVDTANHLLSFDSATPGTVTTVDITGFTADEPGTQAGTETIRGIDFRPATGEMYALGINSPDAGDDFGRIYKLNPTTGALTLVGGGAFKTDFQNANDYSFDINPAADRIRITTDRDDNLRIHPDTGALSVDATFASGSNIVGTAYDRNFDGTAKTTLFGIDQGGTLVRIGGVDGAPSPNGGAVTTIGQLKIGGVALPSLSYKIGFDIESRTGTAYATMRPSGSETSLYTIDLATGATTLLGQVGIGSNLFLHGLTVALPDDLKIVNPTTATYSDQDGDLVTVKITGAAAGAALSKADFRFSTGQSGSQLKLLNFSDDGQEWAKANISINAVTVTKTTNGVKTTFGDSFATVGYLNATGVDLGNVIINGDLGQIDAGDPTTTTPGLKSLTVQSMGVVFNSQLSAVIPNQVSDIVGGLGSLTVKSDFYHEKINVTGGADGTIGKIMIGGDIAGAGLFVDSGIIASGAIGNVTVGGSIFGGNSSYAGSIKGGGIGNVTIGGSLYGGFVANAGVIESTKSMGNVIIKGSIFGGAQDHTGTIHAFDNLGNITIGGSIVGGVVPAAGDIDSGIVYASGVQGGTGNVGIVKIGGSLVGSNGGFSGSVFANGSMKTVTVGGSLLGGTGSQSGTIEAGTGIGAVTISGDAQGNGDLATGSVYTFGNGDIASVTIKGMLTGIGGLTGILSGQNLGPVKIGEVRGTVQNGVNILAEGVLTPATAAKAGGIKSINVTSSITNTLIRAGYNSGSGTASNPDAGIGAVTVGGNWVSSSLVAGVLNIGANNMNDNGLMDDNKNYGDAADQKISEAVVDSIFSKIASVTIKGFAIGTPPNLLNTDFFGIVAEQIGAVKVGLRSYTLATGSDTIGLLLGNTGDFRVKEI